ncbi:protein PF14_0175-like isoform X2 [Sipha flava]|uniref:Protein PF14_0175-like isoform X2 n=1 Tax=Sipha flava TaxID=143950 RepID=A0A8B8GEJ1_9HEMI|nr:protein PF14_0175-like isoform X2 [Sipha flava]
MSEEEPKEILDEYDDGIVCFGPVLTESQLERFKRLPRHTVVPSDLKLSQSFCIDTNVHEIEDNDKSVLGKIQKNTAVHNNDSANTTLMTNNMIEDEIKCCKDNSSIFSSPCASEIISKEKLMNTEELERIRKESISLNDEYFSEGQNNSTFKGNVTDLCNQVCVPDIIKQNISDEQISTPDMAVNICTLIPFGQVENKDLSYYDDSVLEDVCNDDSLVSDEYYITPGKQRIFDMRHTNPSIRSKTIVSSAPSMDRIKENTTPVLPNILNTSSITIIDDNYSSSVGEENLNASDTSKIINNLSTIDFNNTSENKLESTMVVIETNKKNSSYLMDYDTMNTFSSIENLYHTASDEVLKNDKHDTQHSNVDVKVMPADESIYIEKESAYSNNKLLDTPLESVKNDLIKVDFDNALNIVSEINVNGDNDNEKSLDSLNVKKYSNDSSVLNSTYGDAYDKKLFTNNYNEPLKEISQIQDLSNINKICDEEKSMDIMSDTTINETLQTNEFNINNSLKNFTKLDNSYLDTTEHNYSNAVPTALESTSLNIKQHLDIEPVLYKMSFNNSLTCCDDTKINKYDNNDVTQENKLKHIHCSDVSMNSVENKEISIADYGPIESNLSVIIENRTLEESACNDIEKNNEVSNKLSIQNGNISSTNLVLDDDKNFDQKDVAEISNFDNVELNTEPKTPNQEQNLLNNYVQQSNLLNVSKNSLENYNGMENLFDFETEKKVQQFETNTPKVQKLLDFSFVQPTLNDRNQSNKQKLLNFSIVEQTPVSKSIPGTISNKTLNNKNTLIDFSSVDQMQEFDETVSENSDIFKKELKSSFNDNFLNNLSTVSAPDFECFMDESIKTNLSDQSHFTMLNNVTDTDLNQSIYSDEMCQPKMEANQSTGEIFDSKSLDDNNCSIIKDKLSNSLDTTVGQIENLELTGTTEKIEPRTKYLPTVPAKKNDENINSSIVNSNQKLSLNSKECVIVDFSIIEQTMTQTPDLNTYINIKPDENVTNFIDMSMANTTSNGQVFPSSKNSVINVNPDNKTENSLNNDADEINKMTIYLRESKKNFNDTLLTDIQMDNVSFLMESQKKSSSNESFHSIEFNNADEDNKRKMPVQELCSIEKKMKFESEELKTPVSMIYKIKNMFRSSEKPANYPSNTKSSEFKSHKCYHEMSDLENKYNFTNLASLKKSEVLAKSKIPCIVTDKSAMKNDGLNSSSLLNDSIKPKRVIPKYLGVPVLSDVSNSSNRKCSESRIPSKFKK